MLAAASADRLGELSEFRALVFGDSFPSRLSAPFYAVLRSEDGESAICSVPRRVPGAGAQTCLVRA